MTYSIRFVPLLGVAAVLLAACGSDVNATADDAGPGAGGEGDGKSFGDSDTEDAATSCVTDADCDDHDACTHDRCVWSGEFASCENLSSAGEGTCNDVPVPPGFLDPIDPACSGDGGGDGNTGPFPGGKLPGGGKGDVNGTVLFPPFVPLKPDDVPASCSNGFELQQAQPGSVYTLTAKTAQGSRAITLDVDLATYTVPDGITITAIDASGGRQILLDTCRMRTWTAPDPTNGAYRPPDETIRQFRINLPSGTAQLEVKFGLVVSPMYLRLVGLCDFDITPFDLTDRWAPVP